MIIRQRSLQSVGTQDSIDNHPCRIWYRLPGTVSTIPGPWIRVAWTGVWRRSVGA